MGFLLGPNPLQRCYKPYHPRELARTQAMHAPTHTLRLAMAGLRGKDVMARGGASLSKAIQVVEGHLIEGR